MFDVSQSTVSRRWDLLRPLIGKAVACEILPPSQIGGYRVLKPIPTWSRRAGGCMQHMLPYTVQELKMMGYLEEIPL